MPIEHDSDANGMVIVHDNNDSEVHLVTIISFLDVVSAYKNLVKEKEAVDASIKVLTSTQQASPKPSSKTNRKRTEETLPNGSDQDQKSRENTPAVSPLTEKNQDQLIHGKFVSVNDHPLREDPNNSRYEKEEREKAKEKEDDNDENDDDGNDDETKLLREKIMTLTSTLKTVMEQKAIMESNYQADKKKMMVGIAPKQELNV